MTTATHNLCAIVQYLKAHYEPQQVIYRREKLHSVCGFKEADITYLLTLLMLVRKPLYRLSNVPISGVDEFWRKWVIVDLYRLIDRQNGDEKLLPMFRKEQYLLGQEDLGSKAFQAIPIEKQSIYADICFPTLMNRADWTACGWCAHYGPLSSAWSHSSERCPWVDLTRLLELNCPSALLASITKKSEKRIDILREEHFGHKKRTKKRDCGPQLKLLRRSSCACFFVFKATLIFNYSRSLGLSSVAAYYWAIREVKAIPGFEHLVPEDFWLEINVFYWLRANGHFDESSEKGRDIPSEVFPEKLHAYCRGSQEEKLPKFSLRHLHFAVLPSMDTDLKLFITRLNQALFAEAPLLPVFYEYFCGDIK